MTRLLLLAIVFALGQSSAWASETAAASIDGFDRSKTTEHFEIVWNDSTASEEDAKLAAKETESDYDAIAGYLGVDRLPDKRIVVILEGDMFPDGGRRIPHVDGEGRVHLYRSPTGDYLSIFPHELVHALRMSLPKRRAFYSVTGGGFLEKGFAEAVALIAEGSVDRYPYWGFEADVVAWHLVDSGQDVSLAALLSRHRELSLRCELQSGLNSQLTT